jgi:hypothetical protein
MDELMVDGWGRGGKKCVERGSGRILGAERIQRRLKW